MVIFHIHFFHKSYVLIYVFISQFISSLCSGKSNFFLMLDGIHLIATFSINNFFDKLLYVNYKIFAQTEGHNNTHSSFVLFFVLKKQRNLFL